MNQNSSELTCGALMKRISDKMEKHANDEFNSHGVTMTQFRFLMTLNEFPEGKATLKTLEKHFGVAQSTEAGIAVRLEKKGMVSSYTDPNDRRIKILVITEAGKRICAEAHSDMENAERRLLKGLNEQEREQFFTLLEKVYNALE